MASATTTATTSTTSSEVPKVTMTWVICNKCFYPKLVTKVHKPKKPLQTAGTFIQRTDGTGEESEEIIPPAEASAMVLAKMQHKMMKYKSRAKRFEEMERQAVQRALQNKIAANETGKNETESAAKMQQAVMMAMVNRDYNRKRKRPVPEDCGEYISDVEQDSIVPASCKTSAKKHKSS